MFFKLKNNNITQDERRHELVVLLESYKHDYICEAASHNCKTCVFNTSPDVCSLNLVITFMELSLSTDRDEANKQYSKIMNFPQKK